MKHRSPRFRDRMEKARIYGVAAFCTAAAIIAFAAGVWVVIR